MPKSKQVEFSKGYYWVKTKGYHREYSPLYFNGTSWKISINDKDLFISTYKLELLYGRSCVIRAIDKSIDMNDNPDRINAFIPCLSQSNCGNDMILSAHPLLNMVFINGMLAPIKEEDINGWLIYAKGDNE